MTRVPLVEDEESFSDALSYLLRKPGFRVAVCPASPDALEMFDRDGVDLVRPHAPGASWHRRVPEPAPADGCAGDHADRSGHRGQQRNRARAWHRRLCYQALFLA